MRTRGTDVWQSPGMSPLEDSGDSVGSSTGRLPRDCCHPEVLGDTPKAGLPLGTRGRVTHLCHRSWRVAVTGAGTWLSPTYTGHAMPCHTMPFSACHAMARHATPCSIPCRAGRSGIAPCACPDISAPRCQFYTRPRVTPGWPRRCPLSLVPYPSPRPCPFSRSVPQSPVPVSLWWHSGPAAP